MIEFFKANPMFILVVLALGTIVFKTGQWTAGVNKLQDIVNKIEDKLDEILKRLAGVETRLSVLEKRVPEPMLHSRSPVQLTEFGRKISTAVKAKEWAGKYAPELLKTTSGKKEFEIFDECVKHLEKQYGKDKAFKEVIDSGAYEHGVEKEQIQRIFAVVLRDKLLGLIENGPA